MRPLRELDAILPEVTAENAKLDDMWLSTAIELADLLARAVLLLEGLKEDEPAGV